MPTTAIRPKPAPARRNRAKGTDPPESWLDSLWRISVDQYEEMIRAGILTANDPVELLDGCLVRKMSKSDGHILSGKLVQAELVKLVPSTWHVATQDPIRLSNSLPEPDASVIRGKPRDYNGSKPKPNDVGLVVEVSDSSLSKDRGDKKALYARDEVKVFWIVNLVDSVVDVYTDPSGPTKEPDYRSHQRFTAKQRVPVVLNGKRVGTILVADLLP